MPKVDEMPVTATVSDGFNATIIKIKQEKISPPPSRSVSSERADTTDTKPVAEPVKTSSEILADLFKVFNAAPPKINDTDGENDDAEGDSDSATVTHKHKKKHKKEKKTKKPKHKKRDRSSSDDANSNTDLASNDKKKASSKSHKVKKEKKREKRKADNGIEDDSKHKRHKKSKDRDKIRSSETAIVVKKEKCTDDEGDDGDETDREMQKSMEQAAEPKKHTTKNKAIDRLNEKLKERRKSNDKLKDSASSQSTTSTKDDVDLGGGRKKIVIKSLVNSTVFRDTMKEVDAKQKEKERTKEKEKTREKEKTKEKEKKSHGERTHERRRRSRGHRSGSSSLSLSDEETYLKERESRYNSSENKYMDRDRGADDFYGDSRRRERTRERDLRDRNDRYGQNDRGFRSSHYRYEHDRRYAMPFFVIHKLGQSFNRNHLYFLYRRSRSRDRRQNSEDRIDKKRLLEIARKNAITMLKNGTLPGTQNLAADAKEKALAKMRYGGKFI